MFSYYGGKSKVIKYYPKPQLNTIIEPFCGSARYSCRYFDKDIWINDLYEPIYRIWKYIQSATKSDILKLPDMKKGESLQDIKYLSQPERDLLGFCVGQCRNSPGNVLTGWAARDNEIERTKKRLLPFVDGNISHWKITNLNYLDIEYELPATYFIDPPYQKRKTDYMIKNNENFYKNLADYCNIVIGQVIVCESIDADWLPFSQLCSVGGQRRKFTEAIWEKQYNV